jgi:hypothetical protein
MDFQRRKFLVLLMQGLLFSPQIVKGLAQGFNVMLNLVE